MDFSRNFYMMNDLIGPFHRVILFRKLVSSMFCSLYRQTLNPQKKHTFFNNPKCKMYEQITVNLV